MQSYHPHIPTPGPGHHGHPGHHAHHGGHQYGHPPHSHWVKPPHLAKLDNDSVVWLIVGLAGFMLSLGLITGPLAWIFGARLRNQYRAYGFEPSSNATAAWIIGMISTLLYVLVLVGAIAFFVFVAASASLL